MKFDLKGFTFNSGQVKVDNVFKPLIGLGTQLVGSLIVLLVSFIFAPWYGSLTIGVGIAAYFIFCAKKYDYFAKKDPDKLQSETFQIEKRKMEIQASKNPEELYEPGEKTLDYRIVSEQDDVPLAIDKDEADHE